MEANIPEIPDLSPLSAKDLGGDERRLILPAPMTRMSTSFTSPMMLRCRDDDVMGTLVEYPLLKLSVSTFYVAKKRLPGTRRDVVVGVMEGLPYPPARSPVRESSECSYGGGSQPIKKRHELKQTHLLLGISQH